MMPPRTVVSGGAGFVGRFIVERLLAEGHEVVVAGRKQPAEGFFTAPVRFESLDLNTDSDPARLFDGSCYFVHAAFHHLPGRYRGGEGDDPESFRRCNLEGSLTLFRAAKSAGIKRAVFLSSRAVYGEQPPGGELTEDTVPHPNSLYGEVKLACEQRLAALADGGFQAVSLRITGVYGPAGHAKRDKWAELVAGYLAGQPVPSRAGTEVHGEDVAWAVLIALMAPLQASHDVFNVSDIVVDNADVLVIAKGISGSPHPLPPRAAAINVMSTRKLRALGWRPGGRELFEDTVREMAAAGAQ